MTSGTGLSIYTLDWARSAGSSNKSTRSFGGKNGFEYMAGLDGTRQALDRLLPPEAIQAITERLVGRFSPAVSAIERIITRGEPNDWQEAVDDTEARLVSYDHFEERGNLCNEIVRLEREYRGNLSIFKELRTVEEVLGLLFFQRYMFGADKFVLQEAVPELVERDFGRIKTVDGVARTVLDEPFVLKAAENYFKTLPRLTLSQIGHTDPRFSQCAILVGIAAIVGLDEQELQCGISYEHISVEEFMDAHVNTNSFQQGQPVPPFFFPKAKPSGPDIVFCIRLKLRQILTTKDVKVDLKTVSAPTTEVHVKDLGRFCPIDNTYINMIIAYPATVAAKLRPDLKPRPSSHADFLDGIKAPVKLQVVDKMEAESPKKTR
ncbi:hypothetical protein BG015_005456, partial [Linnemannia schmuckeri]